LPTSLVALLALLATTGDAQPPLRIGASLSQTGSFAAVSQDQLRGYQLCVKHANEKGGVLGRRIELLVEDDQSNAATAVAIYEKLIVQGKVDAILGPYSSPITEAVADVSEKHKMPMVASIAATTSIFKKGRKFIFMVFPPAEGYLEGLVEMAPARGSRRWR
jgi:branched-chain amino acid transport system substrate-binding protein